MSKLAQIKEITTQTKQMVEEFERDFNENAQEFNTLLQEFKSLQESLKVTTLQEIQEALEGIEHIKEVAIEPVIECEESVVGEIKPLEPFDVQEPKAGTIGAKFWGLFTTMLIFLGFGAVGAYMKKLNFDPSMINLEFFEKAYSFYSDLITGSSHSGAALGIVISGGIAILIGYIVYILLINKAASSNLQKAQELLEEAKAYIQDKETILQRIKNIKSFLTEAIKRVKGLKVFGDEYAKRVKRIRFFEGDDFNSYTPTSQKNIEDLEQLYEKLSSLVELALCEDEQKVSQEIEQFFQELQKELDRLIEKEYAKV